MGLSQSRIQIRANPLSIPFAIPFRQASKQREASDSIQVLATRGALQGIGEGCPRPYQTHETTASALEWIASIAPQVPDDLEALRERARERGFIDEHPAAWCAVETALLDLFAREAGCTIERLLDQPEQPRRFCYTTVLGIGMPGDAVLDRVAALELVDFKLKVGLELEADQRALAALARRIPNARARLDVNNAFGADADAAIDHLRQLSPYWAIEEPLAARQPRLSAVIGRALGVPIILDEAVLTPDDLRAHAEQDAEWILNIKVSRVGGLLRALELVRVARAAGWGIIVGAQAGETSLLTRAGQIVARAAGDSLRAMEGAIGTNLLTWEPYPVSLAYGRGGWLDLDDFELEPFGWGLGLR